MPSSTTNSSTKISLLTVLLFYFTYCSAGIGRSGTLIMVDTVLEMVRFSLAKFLLFTGFKYH